MMKWIMIIICWGLLALSCKTSPKQQLAVGGRLDNALNTVVYKSEVLVIERLSEHVYLHTSYLQTQDFGKVDCNGMLVVNEGEAVVFDTPANDESTGELIAFTTKQLKAIIKGVIPTHFHEDCVGGVERFNANKIPVFASKKTIDLLHSKNRKSSFPFTGFNDSFCINIGGKRAYASYFGEGHTKDNIVGYFEEDNAVFGGCLIKAMGAGKGNLEDANVNAWPETVRKVKDKYPDAKIVIPGHGRYGGKELLDYTIQLFK